MEEQDLFTVEELFEYKNKIKYSSLERIILEMETSELFRQILEMTKWLRTMPVQFRELRTVEKTHAIIRHKKVGTVMIIIGSNEDGFVVVDPLFTIIPLQLDFKNINDWEVIEK